MCTKPELIFHLLLWLQQGSGFLNWPVFPSPHQSKCIGNISVIRFQTFYKLMKCQDSADFWINFKQLFRSILPWNSHGSIGNSIPHENCGTPLEIQTPPPPELHWVMGNPMGLAVLYSIWIPRLHSLWVKSPMVSAGTQVSLLGKHGGHSLGQLFSLSQVEAEDG